MIGNKRDSLLNMCEIYANDPTDPPPQKKKKICFTLIFAQRKKKGYFKNKSNNYLINAQFSVLIFLNKSAGRKINK
jgi:hypothetical protein